MKRIGPCDQLEIGQAVAIPRYKGIVCERMETSDQHGNPIIVHTLKLTHKVKFGIGGRCRFEPMEKPIVKPCNYSFIQVL